MCCNFHIMLPIRKTKIGFFIQLNVFLCAKAKHTMNNNPEQQIVRLFFDWKGTTPDDVRALPPSGSNRVYYRITSGDTRVIGAYNPYVRENRAFVELTKAFWQTGLPVPEVLAVSEDQLSYLITDLGDTTLFSLLPENKTTNLLGEGILKLYKKAIQHLTTFQVDAAPRIDFSICYPRHAFDHQSMMWDLNYFKYYFLKTSGIPFDEQLLEDDFQTFVATLTAEPSDAFMYRDFQSRNIMIIDDEPRFIDYQGGRKGPPAYDMASLLFDAKANLPFDAREELLDYYIGIMEKKAGISGPAFRKGFYSFVLMRILQALGTYGFRGGYEKKSLFLQSVPYAYNNLAWLREHDLLPREVPHLRELLDQLIDKRPMPGAKDDAQDILPPPDDRLTVRICSFSYKKGIPADNSGNGGGFVFDCRALPNPGRKEAYKNLTGKDKEVVEYLQNEEEVLQFLESTGKLTDQTVKKYLERGFTSLAVCFGCTGGQHRSVFCAEQLAKKLSHIKDIHVVVQHFEEDNWQ